MISKNSFRLDLYTASQALLKPGFLAENPLIRMFLVEFSWVIRCLPYIFIAIILTQPTIKKAWLKIISNNIIVSIIVVLLLNIYGGFLPESIYEVMRGYAPLIVAVCASNRLAPSPIIPILGSCSFGIYLSHLFIVEILQSLTKKIYPSAQSSTFNLLMFAGISFFISWALVYYLSKQKKVSKLMFGI